VTGNSDYREEATHIRDGDVAAGAALAGILLQSLGGGGTIATGFVALAVVGIITSLSPDIRRAPRLAEVAAE